MSWSVQCFGKPAAVRTKVAESFASIRCNEPEQSIANAAASMIDSALAAFPPEYPVKIAAAGSQYQPDAGKPEIINSLSLSIEAVYGFVE